MFSEQVLSSLVKEGGLVRYLQDEDIRQKAWLRTANDMLEDHPILPIERYAHRQYPETKPGNIELLPEDIRDVFNYTSADGSWEGLAPLGPIVTMADVAYAAMCNGVSMRGAQEVVKFFEGPRRTAQSGIWTSAYMPQDINQDGLWIAPPGEYQNMVTAPLIGGKGIPSFIEQTRRRGTPSQFLDLGMPLYSEERAGLVYGALCKMYFWKIYESVMAKNASLEAKFCTIVNLTQGLNLVASAPMIASKLAGERSFRTMPTTWVRYDMHDKMLRCYGLTGKPQVVDFTFTRTSRAPSPIQNPNPLVRR